MTSFAKIKCYAASFFVFYFLYLYVYKCPSTHESFLEHTLGKVIHPFSHSHNKLCGAVDTANDKVTPYVNSVTTFVGDKVHSHPFYKQYQVEAKLNLVKAQYLQHVYPYVIKLFQLFEIVEYHIAVKVNELYAFFESHFHKTVVPHASKLKTSAIEHAETVKEQIKSKLD
ncbi:hypothetical protein FOB63_000378 [Clavispora lusitaniae]|uniref:uncharacterized protein n=1 Tax=Clavispora lusitaniae TaxID=36911 RepID=UPI00202C8B37|nr:hypothetical protein FOB63_000378 [Clavispora lusitaniae]